MDQMSHPVDQSQSILRHISTKKEKSAGQKLINKLTYPPHSAVSLAQHFSNNDKQSEKIFVLKKKKMKRKHRQFK